MYVVIAPIQIKPEYREQFIKEMIEDARGSVNNEPGCLRFDIIQDGNDPNRIWLYEVYRDEAAFQEHLRQPHFIRWRDTTQDWRQETDLQGAGRGAYNIWPPDDQWK